MCGGARGGFRPGSGGAGLYPRVCGGAPCSAARSRTASGLSPRVRGSRRQVRRRGRAQGIIPACAGEPEHEQRELRQDRDYPRVCGGAIRFTPSKGRSAGLSPRVRGSPGSVGVMPPPPGIIPACAGEPPRSLSSTAISRDYPRVCGGAAIRPRTSAGETGLSPRVRGSRLPPAAAERGAGIIPACAGEPRPRRRARCSRGDYPRVCGGAPSRAPFSSASRGLSPRVRGSRGRRGPQRRAGGIIPACAGEPVPEQRPGRADADYPRVCGGAAPAPVLVDCGPGLSPRVRGSRGHRRRGERAGGIIPACAGEPACPLKHQ